MVINLYFAKAYSEKTKTHETINHSRTSKWFKHLYINKDHNQTNENRLRKFFVIFSQVFQKFVALFFGLLNVWLMAFDI